MRNTDPGVFQTILLVLLPHKLSDASSETEGLRKQILFKTAPWDTKVEECLSVENKCPRDDSDEDQSYFSTVSLDVSRKHCSILSFVELSTSLKRKKTLN